MKITDHMQEMPKDTERFIVRESELKSYGREDAPKLLLQKNSDGEAFIGMIEQEYIAWLMLDDLTADDWEKV